MTSELFELFKRTTVCIFKCETTKMTLAKNKNFFCFLDHLQGCAIKICVKSVAHVLGQKNEAQPIKQI